MGQFALHGSQWGGNYSWEVQVADFNSDGRSDILWYSPLSGQWYKGINDAPGVMLLGSGGVWEPGLTVVASAPRMP
jgi:hypothetical protein